MSCILHQQILVLTLDLLILLLYLNILPADSHCRVGTDNGDKGKYSENCAEDAPSACCLTAFLTLVKVIEVAA